LADLKIFKLHYKNDKKHFKIQHGKNCCLEIFKILGNSCREV